MKSSEDSTFIPLRQTDNNPTLPAIKSSSCLIDQLETDKTRSRFGIEVEGADVPPPIKTFEETKLSSKCIAYLRDVKQVNKPTPIQMQGIGCLMRGRDVIGVSSTGSGKSYAYILPLVMLVEEKLKESRSDCTEVAPLCLVILPSRELMVQIFGIIKELLEVGSRVGPTSLTGSTSEGSNLSGNFSHPLGNAVVTNVQQAQVNGLDNHNMHQHSCNNTNLHSSWHDRYDDRGSSGSSHVHNNSDYRTHNHHNNYHFHPYQNTSKSINGHDQINRNNHFNYCNSSNNNSNGNNNNISNSSSNNLNHDFDTTSRSLCSGDVVVGVCGGGPIREDLNKLNSDTKVVVATPGRLIDLCERQKIAMSQIKYLVIDECDKLLDMGLEEQLRKIVAFVMVHKTSPQVSLWSATLPDSLERLARSAVVDPVYVVAGARDTICSNIEQRVMFLHSYMKDEKLLDVLRQIPYPPVIVFVQSKQTCDEVTQLLLEEQFHVGGIHGDKPQTHRNEVVEDFRKGEIDILVATDLMSRGIDIPSVTHIVNFDSPATIEDYIHRCGRCGRLGREGVATTFLTLECKIAAELKDVLKASGNDVPRELMDVSEFGKKVMKTDMGDRVVT